MSVTTQKSRQILKRQNCVTPTRYVIHFLDQLEPEEGKFDFSSIDTTISLARKYDLKLIFLWFATWKNGVMDYAPNT